jgi:glycosyltransferase involved in cell wall biosynthesis
MFDYGKKVNTGFAKQSTEIVKAIKKAYGDKVQLDIVAAGYVPDEIFDYINDGMTEEDFNNLKSPLKCTSMYVEDNGTKVFSAVYHEGVPRTQFFNYKDRGLYGHHLFCELLAYNGDYNYDGIFIMNDLGVVLPMIEELKKIKKMLKDANKKQFKSVYYFPIDCEPPVSICSKEFLFFDKLITYTEYGRSELIKKEPLFNGKVSVIYHGINLKEFFRVDEKIVSEFRDNYFGDNADKFIVGIINRNQFRKDIPTSIFSFIAAKQKVKELGLEDNLFLYLHCYPKDLMGWDLRLLLSQTSLVEGVDYAFPSEMIRDIDTAKLNLIYNSIDLYLSTSLGEGFGLTAIECYATKTLTLVPYSTSYIELAFYRSKRNSIGYGVFNKVCCKEDCIIRWQGDYEEIGESIVEVNDKEAHNIKDNAYEFVKTLSWDFIGKKWVEVFKIY